MSHPTRGAWIETSKIAVCKLRTVKSHPTRGAWIETLIVVNPNFFIASHPTRGAWIETIIRLSKPSPTASHPTRGAWIETSNKFLNIIGYLSRTPPGVRGLKRTLRMKTSEDLGCTPPGVRGLKR